MHLVLRPLPFVFINAVAEAVSAVTVPLSLHVEERRAECREKAWTFRLNSPATTRRRTRPR
jgi:hypothetical protein